MGIFYTISNDTETQDEPGGGKEQEDLKIFPLTEAVESNTEPISEETSEGSNEKKRWNKKYLWLLLIPAVSISIYGGVQYKQKADWYSEHFYPNTKIGSLAIGEMSIEEAEKALDGTLGDYQIQVVQRNVVEVITAEDIGQHYRLEEDGTRFVESYLSQQETYRWILDKDKEYQYELPQLDYDPDAVEAAIDSLICVNPVEVIEPEDAYIHYDEENHTYSIVPEHAGNQVDRDVISNYIYECLDQWGEEIVVPEEDYPQAQVTSEDEFMNTFVNEVETYLSSEITLKDRRQEIKIDRHVIIDFLDIDMEEGTVELVEDRVQRYINTTLEETFDTLGTERTITTDLSGTFTVDGGTYGKIIYTAAELPQLVEEISAGTVTTREPHWRISENGDENDGIGTTYVDVNLSLQELSYIKNGEEVLRSDIVSGKTSAGRSTPTGIYTVELKLRNYTMRKYNAFVNYWMNFNTAVGIGFHDASWRYNFGGSIYQYNGSHGCINMPYGNAKILYNNIEYGCPVIVHW